MLAKITVALNLYKVLSTGELGLGVALGFPVWVLGELLQPPQAAFPLVPTLLSAGYFKVCMLGVKEEK